MLVFDKNSKKLIFASANLALIGMELPNFSVDPIKLHHENNLFSLKTQIA